MIGLLLAMLFMPHQTVKLFPAPDSACLYQWISDPHQIENVCPDALVVDVIYKNGMGNHLVLKSHDVTTVSYFPFKVLACTEGKGVPSAAPDHMVHPGWKSQRGFCMSQELRFEPYVFDPRPRRF